MAKQVKEEFQITPEMETLLTTDFFALTPEETNSEEEEEEKTVYFLADGSQGSRAAFIREKFLLENLSRKDIAKQFNVPYRIVYSATVNMSNEAEGSTRGRTPINATISVTEDGKYVTVVKDKDGVDVVLINGQTLQEANLKEIPTTKVVNRNEWIKSQIIAGATRADIAKILDLSYGVIYNLTKEMNNVKQTFMYSLEDGTMVNRSQYIRYLYAKGKSRSEIAKELSVPYTIVWQATKTEKADMDKYTEILTILEGFKEKIAEHDMDTFVNALTMLSSIKWTELETSEIII